MCTVLVLRMAHRIWKETKQQPGTAWTGNMLGCFLVSFHFLWAILSTSTVQCLGQITSVLLSYFLGLLYTADSQTYDDQYQRHNKPKISKMY